MYLLQQGELREMEKDSELKNEQKLQIKDMIAEQEELKKQAHQQLLSMAADFKVLNEKCLDADHRRQEHKGKLETLDAKIESSKKKQNQHLENQQKIEKFVEEKQTEIETATEKANAVGPRVDSHRHKAQILKDINKQRNAIQVRRFPN
jgi:predicted ATP-grasp superfamily ATP-dependent carboligase